MSEEKIIQHTKKAISIVQKKNTLREKIKDFFSEIIIIIIAVSITLAFHNWNDERHERKIEHDFLTGISADLKQTAIHLNASVKEFEPTIEYYDKIWAQIKSDKIDSKYVDSNSQNLFNTNYFSYDNSRFEGFKSSGYLRLITNERLLKHLVTMYAVVMPFERDADAGFFHTREEDFGKYVGAFSEIASSGNFIVSPLLKQRGVQYHIYISMITLKQRKDHKQKLAQRLLGVAAEIDEELKR